MSPVERLSFAADMRSKPTASMCLFSTGSVKATAMPRRTRGICRPNHGDLRRRGRCSLSTTCAHAPAAAFDSSAVGRRAVRPCRGAEVGWPRRGECQAAEHDWLAIGQCGLVNGGADAGRPQSWSSVPSVLPAMDKPNSRVLARRVCREMPSRRAAWTWLPLVWRRANRSSSRSSS